MEKLEDPHVRQVCFLVFLKRGCDEGERLRFWPFVYSSSPELSEEESYQV